MLLADGTSPGNEGRGYVLRRILRRAVRSMRQLGHAEPVLADLLAVARDAMAPSYPEVAEAYDRIADRAASEEDAFRATLRQGTTVLDTAVARVKAEGGRALPGAQAFLLHDTYGFPIDLTLEMAAEQGLEIDREGFTALMREQRERARADARARKAGGTDLTVLRPVLDEHGPTHGAPGHPDDRLPGPGDSGRRGLGGRGRRGRHRHRRPGPHPLLRRVRRPGQSTPGAFLRCVGGSGGAGRAAAAARTRRAPSPGPVR